MKSFLFHAVSLPFAFFLISIRNATFSQGQNQQISELVQHHSTQCHDLRHNCQALAQAGYCTSTTSPTTSIKTSWMLSHCPQSCHRCHQIVQHVPFRQSFNPIQYRSWYSIQNAYLADLGVPQIISHRNDSIDTNTIDHMVEHAREYMNEIVRVEDSYELVRDRCYNMNESCIEWAIDGWCDQDPHYMSRECGPVCRNCDQLHVLLKCPLPHPNDVINGKVNCFSK
jgi:ShK domain-like